MRSGKSAHRAARELALNLLFQADVARLDLEEAITVALENVKARPEVAEKAMELARGSWEHRETSDAMIRELAPNWPPDRQGSVDRNVLRLALYEMVHTKQTPGPVAIDEAVELAKLYGSEESGKFVNGVLAAALKADGQKREDTSEA